MKPNLPHPPPQKVLRNCIERLGEVHEGSGSTLTGVGPINKGPQREEMINDPIQLCQKPACPLAHSPRSSAQGVIRLSGPQSRTAFSMLDRW
jgi:hypothetical protein